MDNETEIPEKIYVKKKLAKATAEEYNTQIQELHLKEIGHFQDARANDRSSEDRMSDLEDGYLANLQMIKLAKRFPEEQYVKYQLERPCGCSYEDLEIPEWDQYIS